MSEDSPSDQDNNVNEKDDDDETPFYPPMSYEDFIKMEQLDEWPARITTEQVLSLRDEIKDFDSVDNIKEWLREAAELNFIQLDQLLERLDKFGEDLYPYSSKILKKHLVDGVEEEPEIAVDDASDGQSNSDDIPQELSVLDIRNNVLETSAMVKIRRKGLDSKAVLGAEDEVALLKQKTVEYCRFPGFQATDFTPLPASLEALQVLHRIRKAVPVPAGFKRLFIKIFLSEASVGFMQDAFWWMFIDMYEPDNEDARRELFGRMADSYAALFSSVHEEAKDIFFQPYPEAIAMALYATFYEAFPESRKLFGAHFKQRLVNTVHEWCTGIHPLPNSFLTWNIAVIESSDLPVTAGADTADQLHAPSRVSERVQKAMTTMTDPTLVKLDIDDFRKSVENLGKCNPSKGNNAVLTGRPTDNNTMKSHPMGSTTLLRTIKFDHMGQSPLILHYQAMHGRTFARPEDRRAGLMRTEVLRLPDTEQPTYQDFLAQQKQKQGKMKEDYVKMNLETDEEIARLTKRRKEINAKIKRLQQDLDSTKSIVELKFFINEHMGSL